jgi:hypothetical protein
VSDDITESSPKGINPLNFQSNFFLGRNSFTDVMSYAQVIYQNLLQGVSIKFEPSPQGPKYNFLVNSNSELPTGVPESGLLKEQIHFLTNIDSNSKIQNYFNVNEVQNSIFNTASVNVSTYIGGTGADRATSVDVDNSGNIYITGTTTSIDFPTLNAFNDTLSGSHDCFVTKFDLTGSVIYSTYVGGTYSTLVGSTGNDYSESIAVGSDGSVYVTGNTRSDDFPTTEGAYDQTMNSGDYEDDLGDCFIFKLNPDGDSLVYSTYVGGTSADHGLSIDIDNSGAAYVTGWTTSLNFPLVNPFDDETNSGREAFVLKLSSSGDSLEFSSYLGGSNTDIGLGIDISSDREVFITGYTDSSQDTFPIRGSSPFDSTHNGLSDCFVVKLESSGNPEFATFVGGSDTDQAYSIAVDSHGYAWVTGRTKSADFPLDGALDNSLGGEQDAFVFKLDLNGEELIFATYVGGSNTDRGQSIEVDSQGAGYIVGRTSSTDLTLTSATDYNENPGGESIFLTKLSSWGNNTDYQS